MSSTDPGVRLAGQHPSAVLLGAQLLAVLAYPFLDSSTLGRALLGLVGTLIVWIVLVNASLHAPFYFYVSYGMIRYLFHDNRVTRDELYATGAAFTVAHSRDRALRRRGRTGSRRPPG